MFHACFMHVSSLAELCLSVSRTDEVLNKVDLQTPGDALLGAGGLPFLFVVIKRMCAIRAYLSGADRFMENGQIFGILKSPWS